jgi:hypothetical protein
MLVSYEIVDRQKCAQISREISVGGKVARNLLAETDAVRMLWSRGDHLEDCACVLRLTAHFCRCTISHDTGSSCICVLLLCMVIERHEHYSETWYTCFVVIYTVRNENKWVLASLNWNCDSSQIVHNWAQNIFWWYRGCSSRIIAHIYYFVRIIFEKFILPSTSTTPETILYFHSH